MSGGIEEVWEKKSMTPLQKKNMWYIIYQAYKKNSIIACSVDVYILFQV
jgi:hypothetical protein